MLSGRGKAVLGVDGVSLKKKKSFRCADRKIRFSQYIAHHAPTLTYIDTWATNSYYIQVPNFLFSIYHPDISIIRHGCLARARGNMRE